MKVPKGLAEQVSAIAERTPREAVANLLKALLPRQPVATRPPSRDAVLRRPPMAVDPFAPPPSLDPFVRRRRRSVRTRGRRWISIELIVRPEASGLNRGSGRYAKLKYLWDNNVTNAGECLGVEVVDAKGKSHTIDMGALHGMASRGHIKLGE